MLEMLLSVPLTRAIKTKLLMHFEGPNGSTVFTDAANPARNFSVFGSAALSNAQPLIGTTSLAVTAGTSYVQAADSPELHLSGEFTLEFFMYLNTVGTGYQTALYKATSTAGSSARIQITSGGMFVGADDATGATPTINAPLSALKVKTRQHFALESYNGKWTIYIDGVQQAQVAVTTQTFGNNSSPLQIGGDFAGAYSLGGYLDELRLSNVARYKGPFTPTPGTFVID